MDIINFLFRVLNNYFNLFIMGINDLAIRYSISIDHAFYYYISFILSFIFIIIFIFLCFSIIKMLVLMILKNVG